MSTLAQLRMENHINSQRDHEAQVQRVRERYEFMDSAEMQAFKRANPGYTTGFDPAKHPGPWWSGE